MAHAAMMSVKKKPFHRFQKLHVAAQGWTGAVNALASNSLDLEPTRASAMQTVLDSLAVLLSTKFAWCMLMLCELFGGG